MNRYILSQGGLSWITSEMATCRISVDCECTSNSLHLDTVYKNINIARVHNEEEFLYHEIELPDGVITRQEIECQI